MIKDGVWVSLPKNCAECYFIQNDSDWGWSCSRNFFESNIRDKLADQGLEIYEFTPELIEKAGGTSLDCMYIEEEKHE